MNKIWKIKKIDESLVEEYTNKFNVTEFTAKMLIAKGIDEASVANYLDPDISKLYDPYLLEDMDKMVERIIQAKENNEKVAIYGD